MKQERVGILFAIGAYSMWGLFPIYWKLLQHVSADLILAHRILWSLLFYFLIWFFFFRKPGARRIEMNRKLGVQILLASALISVNWFVYIWGVNSGHVLETSIGYFINPLVNVLLGFIILKEKLSRNKWLAIGLATCGVLLVSYQVKEIWIALVLAFSFAFYGLLRKIMKAQPIQTSFIETLVLSLPALFYVFYTSERIANWELSTYLLLAAGGAVTGLPLWWFAEAASRTALSTMGLFQFISPTMQFLLAVLLYHEPFEPLHAWSFGLIWFGLGVFVWDLVKNRTVAKES
jgi:chloramphenicol-sensitive protein RarD